MAMHLLNKWFEYLAIKMELVRKDRMNVKNATWFGKECKACKWSLKKHLSQMRRHKDESSSINRNRRKFM